MNAYESGVRKNIPAVLIYVECDGKILMIHRNSPDRPDDFHAGKWNGLGGKCEADESALEAARRELHEESGLLLEGSEFQFAGYLQFPNFKPAKAEDWSVCLFTTKVNAVQAASVVSRTAEGALHWIEREKLFSLNLWPADREFLPWVMERKPFIGCVHYRDGGVAKAEFRLIASAIDP